MTVFDASTPMQIRGGAGAIRGRGGDGSPGMVRRRSQAAEWQPGGSRPTGYPLAALRRRALAITDTDETLMARAATRGLRSQPVSGYSTPAASGIPRAL